MDRVECQHSGCLSIQLELRLTRQTRRPIKRYWDYSTYPAAQHEHDPNSYLDFYVCSNGHLTEHRRVNECLVETCMYNKLSNEEEA